MDDVVRVVARLYLDADGDSAFEPFGEVGPEKYEEIVEALSAVRRFMQYDVMQIVIRNLELHQELVAELMVQASGALGLGGIGSVEGYRAVLTSTLNFCSSIHSYQEHAEVRARRRGGQAQFDEVHSMFSKAYDQSPDLFLVRKLRDAMVHNSLEVVGYDQQQSASADRKPKPGQARTFLVTAQLLPLKNVFNKDLRDHLNSYGDEIDLLLLMVRATDALANLNEDLVDYSFPDLVQHARTVDAFLTQIEGMGAHPEEQLLLMDYDRKTRLPIGDKVQAISVRPETTSYARLLITRGSLRRHPTG